jgi:hypothetical protein
LIEENISLLKQIFSQKNLRIAHMKTALPWGFFSLRRFSTQEATYTKFSMLGCDTPSAFSQPLDVFFLTVPLQPCFMPNPSMGLKLSEVSPF